MSPTMAAVETGIIAADPNARIENVAIVTDVVECV